MKDRWWKLSLQLTALAVGIALVISLYVAWSSQTDLLSRLTAAAIAPILGCAIISCILRVLRFHFFMKAGHVPIALRGTLVVQMVGFAMTVTPGHIGEIFKLHLIRERTDTPVTQTAPVLMLDRVTEGGGFLLLALIAATFVPPLRDRVPSSWVLILGMAALLGFAIAQYFLRGRDVGTLASMFVVKPIERFIPYIQNLWRGLKASFTVPQIVVGVLLASLARCFDGLVLLFAARLLGVDITPATAILIFAISGLAGGISLLPGGTGAVETTMAGLLVLTGTTFATGLAIALVARLFTLWLWVALGLGVAFALQLNPARAAAEATVAQKANAPAHEGT